MSLRGRLRIAACSGMLVLAGTAFAKDVFHCSENVEVMPDEKGGLRKTAGSGAKSFIVDPIGKRVSFDSGNEVTYWEEFDYPAKYGNVIFAYTKAWGSLSVNKDTLAYSWATGPVLSVGTCRRY